MSSTEASQPKSSHQEARQMGENSAYLAQTVGIPLKHCLAELTSVMPADPVEWIAQWLYCYTDNELYFYEKNIYLKDQYRMKLEFDRHNERRQSNRTMLSEKITNTKVIVKTLVKRAMERRGKRFLRKTMTHGGSHRESGQHSGRHTRKIGRRSSEDKRKFKALKASRHGKRFAMEESGNVDARSSLQHWVDDLSATHGTANDHRYSMAEKSHKTHASRVSFLHDGEGESGDHLIAYDELISEEEFSHIKDALEKFSVFLPDYVDKEYLNARTERLTEVLHILNQVGEANWTLDKKASLVCHHTVLGTMEPRPVFVPPETPEWWEKMGYLECTLYDHEIYSTDTDAGHGSLDMIITKLPRLTYDDYAPESQRKPSRAEIRTSRQLLKSSAGDDG